MHDIIRFLDEGVSSYHVARSVADRLRESGFRRLSLGDTWQVTEGDAVFLEQGGSVVALRIGSAPMVSHGMVILAAHTDSPGLQMKPHSATFADGLVQVPVEVYGAPILASWMDRELTIAGQIVVRDKLSGTVRTVLIAGKRPMAVIPNLAIHLNREVNEGAVYNRQDHLKALMAPGSSDGREDGQPQTETDARNWIYRRVAELAGVTPEEIIDTELFLVPIEPARLVGDGGLIVSPRIDNVAGTYSVVQAITHQASPVPHTQGAVFFNHEEIGSATNVGAAGALLESVLRRVVTAVTGEGATFDQVLARSLLVSNDAAHARHPNYADKHDPGYAPVLGGGPVIKKSAIWRYVGDLAAAGWFATVCEEADVPVQYLQNRSDIRAGSTIGPAVAARLGLRGLDVGIPMLAMHSARETASTVDVDYMTRALQALLVRNNDEILDPDSAR
ncbi:MAG: M18 family aminopeptidase [Alkalispirochaeta sp.]